MLARISTKLRGPNAWRTWVGIVLMLAASGYTLYLLLWRDRAAINLGELLARVDAGDVALAVLVYSLDLACAIVGWVTIIGMLSGFWRPLEHLRIYCLTAVTRRLPGTFWYLLGRIVMYERHGVPRSLTTLAGGLEFATNCVGGILVALLAWPLVLSNREFTPLLLLPLLLGAALLNPPVVRSVVRRLSRQHTDIAIRYRHILLWVAIFALAWAGGGVLLYVVIYAVHPLPLSQLPAIIGVWAVLGVAATLFFSFLPFGLGATELTLTALLSSFISPPEALFVALLMRVLLTLCEVGYALLVLPLGLLQPHVPASATSGGIPHPDAIKPDEVRQRGAAIPPQDRQSNRHIADK